MNMTPTCNEASHKAMSGKCPICGHIVGYQQQPQEDLQRKSLQGSEDLRKILP